MRIKRSIIIPAILMLSVAGSTLAATAVPLAAAQASSTQVLAAAPNTWFHG
jgi:hypothetical protein